MPSPSAGTVVLVTGGRPLVNQALAASIERASSMRSLTTEELDDHVVGVVVMIAEERTVAAKISALRVDYGQAPVVLVTKRVADPPELGCLVVDPDGDITDLVAQVVAIARTDDVRPRGELSPRQLEVVALLARGMSTKAIARHLGISLHTCRDHIKHARIALGCTTAMGVVLEAGRRGWLA